MVLTSSAIRLLGMTFLSPYAPIWILSDGTPALISASRMERERLSDKSWLRDASMELSIAILSEGFSLI